MKKLVHRICSSAGISATRRLAGQRQARDRSWRHFYTLEGFHRRQPTDQRTAGAQRRRAVEQRLGVIGIVQAPRIRTRRKFLSTGCCRKEGQELYVRSCIKRRAVSTWTRMAPQHGVQAARDVLTIDQYHKVRIT